MCALNADACAGKLGFATDTHTIWLGKAASDTLGALLAWFSGKPAAEGLLKCKYCNVVEEMMCSKRWCVCVCVCMCVCVCVCVYRVSLGWTRFCSAVAQRRTFPLRSVQFTAPESLATKAAQSYHRRSAEEADALAREEEAKRKRMNETTAKINEEAERMALVCLSSCVGLASA